jgi:hypothetical protein
MASRPLKLIALCLVCVLVAAACYRKLPGAPGCPIFPKDNYWHADVRGLPVHPRSDQWVDTIGRNAEVHADFGSGQWAGGPIGIPYTTVPGDQPLVDITFDYGDESDPGPYPLPPDAPIEGGPNSNGDRHVLVVDRDACALYEVYAAYPQTNGTWEAGSGAVWDLRSNDLHPDTWTSADAAGLPILSGLVRHDEVTDDGWIGHAIRFTAPQTRSQYIWPARHEASSLTGVQYPPMGAWFRLKTSVDISGFSPQARAIAIAMQTHGLILADNGSPWYLSGAPDEGWDNDALHELDQLTGDDFEAVDTSSLVVDPDSGQIAP